MSKDSVMRQMELLQEEWPGDTYDFLRREISGPCIQFGCTSMAAKQLHHALFDLSLANRKLLPLLRRAVRAALPGQCRRRHASLAQSLSALRCHPGRHLCPRSLSAEHETWFIVPLLYYYLLQLHLPCLAHAQLRLSPDIASTTPPVVIPVLA